MFECLSKTYLHEKNSRLEQYLRVLLGNPGDPKEISRVFENPPYIDLGLIKSIIAKRFGYSEDSSESKQTLAWLSSVVIRFLFLADEISCLRRGLENKDAGAETFLRPEYKVEDGIAWIGFCQSAKVLWFSPSWGNHSDSFFTTLDKDGKYTVFGEKVKHITEKIHAEKHILTEEKNDDPYVIFNGLNQFNPCLGFFPFYLLDERRRFWDVVPFATQQSIVLVTSKHKIREHAWFFNTWRGEGADTNLREVSKKEIDSFIKSLNDLASIRGFGVYYRGRGHAAPYMLYTALDPGSRSVMPSSDWLMALPPTNAFDNIRNKIMRPEEGDLNFFLADSGDDLLKQLRLTKGLWKKTYSWKVSHGLQIPVGIGFSLATIPLFFANPQIFHDVVELARWVARDAEKAKLELDGLDVYPIEQLCLLPILPDASPAPISQLPPQPEPPKLFHHTVLDEALRLALAELEKNLEKQKRDDEGKVDFQIPPLIEKGGKALGAGENLHEVLVEIAKKLGLHVDHYVALAKKEIKRRFNPFAHG